MARRNVRGVTEKATGLLAPANGTGGMLPWRTIDHSFMGNRWKFKSSRSTRDPLNEMACGGDPRVQFGDAANDYHLWCPCSVCCGGLCDARCRCSELVRSAARELERAGRAGARRFDKQQVT